VRSRLSHGELTPFSKHGSVVLLEDIVAGGGANDIKMIKAAELDVAFQGYESLKEQANASIDDNDLKAHLYVQGFRKSQFVLS